MSVYQISGNTVTVANYFGTASISIPEAVNPITGSIGVTLVRLTNTSTYQDTFVTWQNLDATYSYTNVPVSYTNNLGTGATFDVVVTSNGYVITINNGGINYEPQDGYPSTIVLSGANLGGTDGDNDVILNVTATTGDPDYSITEFSIYSQNPRWPQSIIGGVPVLPSNTTVVQITSGNQPAGVSFTSNGGDGDLSIKPIAIVNDSVVQIAGLTSSISNGSYAYALLDTTGNPITGGNGVLIVQVQSTSTNSMSTITWTNTNNTYPYTNIPAIGGNGSDATFDVIVLTDNGSGQYQVTLNNIGVNYQVNDSLTIPGSSLGGTDNIDDCNILILTIDENGGILTFEFAGQGHWPQSVDGSTTIVPQGTEYIQVNSGSQPGAMYFTNSVADGSSVYITPVNIAG